MDVNEPKYDANEASSSAIDQPRRRIVSRTQYALLRGKRISMSSSAGLLRVCAMWVSLPMMWLTTKWFVRGRDDVVVGTTVFAFWVPLSYGVSVVIKHLAERLDRKAKVLDIGVPLTNSIADEMSAEEVLVRGAEKPKQEQDSVLLRAAGHSDTPIEQLLRPGARTAE